MARTLLTLSVEIRLDIYERHFKAQVINRGFGTRVSDSISLLSTCRQIHEEARPLIGHINSFHFRSTAALLDTLTTLNPQQIQEIRHIRVKGYPLPLFPYSHGTGYTTYHFSDFLPLFSGLQLDRLEVEDAFHDNGKDLWADIGTYNDVESLVESDGWKELCFVTPTTGFMTRKLYDIIQRREQPDGWNQDLLNRDGGEESGAYVRMFMANESGVRGITEDPNKHTPYSVIPGHLGKFSPAEEVTADGVRSVIVPLRVSEIAEPREVSIVAKRGKDVSYVQDGSKLLPKIQALFDNMTWQETKSSHYLDAEDNPCVHIT